MKNKKTLPKAIKKMVKAVLLDTVERNKRLRNGSGTAFDELASDVISKAKENACPDIDDINVRRAIEERMIFSLMEGIPYAKMGECFCGENKFYHYRRQFTKEIAANMGFWKDSEKDKTERRC